MRTALGTRALALMGVAALGLTACGGADEATTSPATSAASSTAGGASSAPASSTATQASTAASGEASGAATQASQGSAAEASQGASEQASKGATEQASEAPVDSGATHTDQQLALMLKGATVAGQKVEPIPSQYLSAAKTAGKQQVEALKSAQVEPAACKAASIEAAELVAGPTPMAGGGAKKFIIFLRSMPSTEAAKQMVETTGKAAEVCPSSTTVMTVGGKKSTMKTQAKRLTINSATSRTETGQLSTVTGAAPKPMTTTVAVGHVDNVLIQLTAMSGAVGEAELSEALESVAKAVAAKK